MTRFLCNPRFQRLKYNWASMIIKMFIFDCLFDCLKPTARAWVIGLYCSSSDCSACLVACSSQLLDMQMQNFSLFFENLSVLFCFLKENAL